MTRALEEAFAEASRLPEVDQDAFAAWMFDELRSERRWQGLFAESQDLLERLADEALEENRRGETLPLDPSKL